MFEVITKWNLAKPNEEMKDSVANITLRGYNNDTFLTGEFAKKIHLKEIKALSLNTIVGKYCPTRRDLYFEKGVNRLNGCKSRPTWGRKAGYVVEDYMVSILNNRNNVSAYSALIKNARNIDRNFRVTKKSSLTNLASLETSSYGIKYGATDWLKVLLSNMGRAELGLKLLHSAIKEKNSLDIKQIELKPNIITNPSQIGINAPATPDFMIPEFGVVGDIKTGTNFVSYFLLTCAGYALAYENSKGKNNDINWGIIYFFPTRFNSDYVKPLTFAQIYIFPIDDLLREWFTDIRDQAYNIISNTTVPEFPLEIQRENCIACRFKDHCKSLGLDLTKYE